jgi:hypothetical protein
LKQASILAVEFVVFVKCPFGITNGIIRMKVLLCSFATRIVGQLNDLEELAGQEDRGDTIEFIVDTK